MHTPYTSLADRVTYWFVCPNQGGSATSRNVMAVDRVSPAFHPSSKHSKHLNILVNVSKTVGVLVLGNIKDQNTHVVWTPPPLVLNRRSPCNGVDTSTVLAQKLSSSCITAGSRFNIVILFLNDHHQGGDFTSRRLDAP